MRRLLVLVCLFTLARGLRAGEAEVPVAVTTANGSRILGLLQSRPVMFRKNEGGQVPVLWSTVKSIALGERLDPNVENDALLAINDLQSDSFEKRSAAEAALRKLGHAAIRPLRTAAGGSDAETAARAKTILAELTGRNAADRASDYIVYTDDKSAGGELSVTEFVVRTRYGVFAFASQSLVSIDVLKREAVPVEKLVALKDADKPRPVLGAEEIEKADASRWNPIADAAEGREVDFEANVRHMSGDFRPKPGGRNHLAEVQRGESIDDAFAEWGVLFRASRANGAVQIDDSPERVVFGGSVERRFICEDSDIEVNFVVPGSFSAAERDGRAAGVTQLGAFVKANGEGTVGLAVYDRAGRQLAQVLNRQESNLVAGGIRRDEFLGVRSNVPIARARFFRVDAGKVKDMVIDDFVYDRVVDIERDPRRCRVWLSSGEQIVGVLVAGAAEASAGDAALRIAPEFLDPKAEPASLPLIEIERYDPPQIAAVEKIERTWRGTPHGVLLQNGDTFHARLLKLDEKEVLFGLPGGVEMKLPRDVLRKIELQAPDVLPGTPTPPVVVAGDEKPGVDFRKRNTDPAKKDPKPPEGEKKPEGPNPAAGLPRMDDVEIVGADPAKGELTVRDDAGDFDIGFNMARTLVFKPNPEAAKPNPKFRDWTLQLREGSRFDVFVTSIGEKTISVEMAGGSVTLPVHVIEFLQRQKR
ncbi:MAG TPA: hypothetical protein VEJ63_02285 [Planctomycetota bacterium]|nr:hypothetical protein [Planctomycetota bacterium]